MHKNQDHFSFHNGSQITWSLVKTEGNNILYAYHLTILCQFLYHVRQTYGDCRHMMGGGDVGAIMIAPKAQLDRSVHVIYTNVDLILCPSYMYVLSMWTVSPSWLSDVGMICLFCHIRLLVPVIKSIPCPTSTFIQRRKEHFTYVKGKCLWFFR